MAVYLALGDGIEASNDKDSPVIWNNLSFKKPYPLPEGVFAVSKYVKGPKEIQLFLSQVGIVNSKEQGNKYQKSLRPGQSLISESFGLDNSKFS